uniref:Uncharacterized protein n=1 Tax=Zea mays TaxID=4577 RepID=B6U2P6_MAIZE|nr:hypothetical protein [Zea mays]
MSNMGQSFQAGKAQAQGECQAERAAQCVRDGAGATACAVTDTAGAAADSAQLQEHRAAGTVQQAAEQVAQTAAGAAAGANDAVTGGH